MPRWNQDDLDRFNARKARAGGALPDAQPERHQAPALDAAVPREAKGVQCIVVRFVGYRVQPLDPDNFAGSVKDLLDGLRHAGLVSGDEPWRIRLVTDQEKVAHYAEEKTVIEITKENP
jgi:hypothetical protein